jgi:hypothetical protein
VTKARGRVRRGDISAGSCVESVHFLKRQNSTIEPRNPEKRTISDANVQEQMFKNAASWGVKARQVTHAWSLGHTGGAGRRTMV